MLPHAEYAPRKRFFFVIANDRNSFYPCKSVIHIHRNRTHKGKTFQRPIDQYNSRIFVVFILTIFYHLSPQTNAAFTSN